MTTVKFSLDFIHLDYGIKKRKQRSITLISNEIWYIDVYPIFKLVFYFVLLHCINIVLTILKEKSLCLLILKCVSSNDNSNDSDVYE